MFRQKIDWLAEGVNVGEKFTAGYGAIITVGKNLSVLASLNPNIQLKVETALNNAAEIYRKTFEETALIRVRPVDPAEGERVYSHIEDGTLRGFNTIHRASAAGDPHFHAHIVLSSYAVPQYKRDPDDNTRKSVWSGCVMRGEGRVIDVAAQAARKELLKSLVEQGIWVNPLNGEVIVDDLTSESLLTFSKMKGMIEMIQEAGVTGDDEQARILARQQIQNGGEGNATPGWLGKEVGEVFTGESEGIQTLKQQIQFWKNRKITINTEEGELQINLSKAEQLEHVIDGLFMSGEEGKQVVRQWWDEMLGPDVSLAELGDTLKACSEQNNLKLPDYIRQLAGAAHRAKLTKQRMFEHSEAIAIVLSFQEGREITGEEILAKIEEHFIYNPKTGWAEPIETIKNDLGLVAAYEDELQPVDTVEDALAITKGVSIVSGVAGAGKTSAVAGAAARWTASGGLLKEQVWCVSRNAKTALDLGNVVRDVFEQREGGDEGKASIPGLQNMSLAQFRREVGKDGGPKPGDRIIVDEYALAEREDLWGLLKLANNGIPVTMLGDVHQQEAIETPTAAQWLAEAAKSFGQPILGETKRCAAWKQEHDWLRAAPFDEPSRNAIVAKFLEDGNTEVVSTPADLVRSAMASGVDMLLAIDNETVNILAKEWRNQLGTVNTNGPSVELRGGLVGYVGDSVRVRRIYYDRKERIALTGEVGEIVSIERHLVKIKIINNTSSRVISIPKHRVGEVISLGYVSTIDSAQGMTCTKAGVVLRGGEDGHAFYSGGTRGTKFPKVLIFNNKEGLGDGAQYVQEEIVPRIVLDQVLSRSNRGPDWTNLDSYKEEFKRRGDQVGEDLVIQVLNNAVTHEAERIIKQPLEPPTPPVIPAPQQQHSRSLFARNKDSHELDSHTVEFKLPSSKQEQELFANIYRADSHAGEVEVATSEQTPPPTVVPPPATKPQTMQQLCEELLKSDVAGATRIGEELIKHPKEFAMHWETLDSVTWNMILNKLPDSVIRKIERKLTRQQQQEQQQQNEREIEF
jgi:hypothetical protein